MKKKLFILGLTAFLMGCSSDAEIKYEYPSENEYDRKDIKSKIFGDDILTFNIRPTVKKLAETPEEIALAEQQEKDKPLTKAEQNEKIKQLDTEVSELKEQMQQMNQNKAETLVVAEQTVSTTPDLWKKSMGVLIAYPLEQSNKADGFISTEWFNIEPKKQIKYNVLVKGNSVDVTALVRTYEQGLGWLNQKNDTTLADQIKNDILK